MILNLDFGFPNIVLAKAKFANCKSNQTKNIITHKQKFASEQLTATHLNFYTLKRYLESKAQNSYTPTYNMVSSLATAHTAALLT